jgi:WD40 repeat protein
MSSPRCVASTSTIDEEASVGDPKFPSAIQSGNNFYKEAQWSPDGTCLITNSADNGIRTFVVPPELLEEEKQPHNLSPYSIAISPEPVKAYDCYTGYDLSNPSTALVLSSQRDLPVRLSNVLDGSKVASYPLIHPTTEAFISPYSLLFSRGGSHFAAGSDSVISVFDASRSGEGPISYLPTSAKKSSGAMSMKGIVSALDIDEASGILAAGTFSRHVGLYDNGGQGDCVGVFCVQGTDADNAIGGAGITQIKWSSDGRYLFIAERKSDGVMFYDIRNTGQLLGWLVGRNARTNQRLGVDVITSGDSTTIWAGASDGYIRRWLNPHEHEGAVEVDMEWQGHIDAASSVVSHQSGSVLASCAGQRREEDEVASHTLKIWSLN